MLQVIDGLNCYKPRFIPIQQRLPFYNNILTYIINILICRLGMSIIPSKLNFPNAAPLPPSEDIIRRITPALDVAIAARQLQADRFLG